MRGPISDAGASPVSARAAAAEAAAPAAEVPAPAASASATAAAPAATREDDGPAPAARAARPSLAPHVRAEERGNHDGEKPADDDEEQENRKRTLAPSPALHLRGGLVGARDDLLDGVEPGGDAVGDLALAEARRDVLAQDLARERIGQLGLEAVPNLEAHLPVVDEDQEDDPVVETLLTHPPGLSQADRVVFQALALQRAEDGDDDLVAALPLAHAEPVLEAGAVIGREHSGVVVDPVVW